MPVPHRTSWRLIAHDLQWRWWGDQLVVYHQASGDTHLLNRLAGEVLCTLEQAPAEAVTLAGHVAAQQEMSADQQGALLEQIERLLRQLEALGLVETVPS